MPHISAEERNLKNSNILQFSTANFTVAHDHTLTTGCMVVLGIMNCICWANMAAAVFCWIRLFRPLISSWVFRWAGGWRYLQFSLVQRPWAGKIKSMGEDGREETKRITSLIWKRIISDQWGTIDNNQAVDKQHLKCLNGYMCVSVIDWRPFMAV